MIKYRFAFLALLAVSTSITAAERRRPDVRVAYADLDLRSTAGIRALDRRIAFAVKAVCPNEDGTIDVARKREARRCLASKSVEVARQRQSVIDAAVKKGAMASALR